MPNEESGTVIEHQTPRNYADFMTLVQLRSDTKHRTTRHNYDSNK